MRRLWLVFSQAVTVALAALFVVITLKPEWLGEGGRQVLPAPTVVQAPAAPAPDASDAAAPATASFSAAARRATPAVVSIIASKTARTLPPADPRLRFFGNRSPAQPPLVGLGSGVIATPEGYLLTNNHVIEGADDVQVQLADGRQAAARVVGTDPETDLAVLKIDLARLPTIVFGDSAALAVGDVVLAIGNPFNVGQTVTAGIVSALDRNSLGLSEFENFIQTDAAINFGNSGGALVDVQGHLVGISTAIFSRSGGSVGIGFAIPADSARQVMDSLIREGRVVRGWIGVGLRELTPEMAEGLGLPVRQGVLIAGVFDGGPAAQAGVKPGDVVVKVGETPVASMTQLRAAVAALKPASRAVLGVQRDKQTLQLALTVAERQAQAASGPR